MSLTNITSRGFHPSSERDMGAPRIPRVYHHTPDSNFMTFNYVDDNEYCSHTRADLTLLYVYDTAQEFQLGGEFVTLPIVERIYRRDRNLCWSEIEHVLRGGRIPARYSDGAANTGPMNPESFNKFVRRFYIAPNAEGRQILHERGSSLYVEKEHADFEWLLTMMIPNHIGQEETEKLSPQQLVQAARHIRGGWHIDSLLRAEEHWRWLHRV